jgi:hypothetical protein
MTMVRINVAKSELTFSIPIFAKIAVKAAKPAESSAQNTQESSSFFHRALPAIEEAAFTATVSIASKTENETLNSRLHSLSDKLSPKRG